MSSHSLPCLNLFLPSLHFTSDSRLRGSCGGPTAVMSLLLFSGLSSLAATTEKLESKCQGTSGCGSYWPGIGLHLHCICGMDLGQIVVPLGTTCYSMEVSVSRKPLRDEGGKIKGQTDTRKATPRPPTHG